MVLVQKWRFFQLFFYTIQTRKMYSMIFQIEKTPFQGIKTTSSKSRKIDIFPKGKPMVLVQKWPLFQLFFYALQTRKMYSMIFQNEKTPLQVIKTRSSKSRIIDIFLKGVNPWFWSKNGHFFQLFFLRKIDEENVFYDILE